MTVVRINAITVEPGAGDQLAARFAQRAGAVDHAEGFEGFELLRPSDGRDTWLVVTRWRDEEAFRAWTTSPAFAHGHRGAGEGGGGDSGGGGGSASAGSSTLAARSELWSFDVVDLSASK